nr:MAG TPA: hypothetical protein [Caudoviricetes sp.]
MREWELLHRRFPSCFRLNKIDCSPLFLSYSSIAIYFFRQEINTLHQSSRYISQNKIYDF